MHSLSRGSCFSRGQIISFLRGNQLLGCREGEGEQSVCFLTDARMISILFLLLLFFEMRSYNALIILKLEGSTDLPV